ncbi:hypothetical protein GW17_00055908 [Ensete ventricosum]|nr:hypothetical protein GW17_00055908 [Ensete ventricosum]
MSKLLAQRRRKRAATIAALRYGQRPLTALTESMVVALGLAKGGKAENKKLSALEVALYGAKSLSYMGNPSC